MTKLSDEWQTPRSLFYKLDQEFNFQVDLCASSTNAKAEYIGDIFKFYPMPTIYSGFMNPPYSDPRPFIERAWELSKIMNVVCLLKVDPSTKWWGIFWDYETHQPKEGCRIRYPYNKDKKQGKRIKFDPPPLELVKWFLDNGTDKDKKLARRILEGKITTPAFPSAIVIMDRRNLQ